MPAAAERASLEGDALDRALRARAREPRDAEGRPHRQAQAVEQPVAHPRVERRAIERLDQDLEIGETAPRPRDVEPPANREAALAERVALRRRDQEVQGLGDLLLVLDPVPPDVDARAEAGRQPAAHRKPVRIFERRAGDPGVAEASLPAPSERPDSRGELPEEPVHPVEDLAVVRIRLEEAQRLVEPDEVSAIADRGRRERREQAALLEAGCASELGREERESGDELGSVRRRLATPRRTPRVARVSHRPGRRRWSLAYTRVFRRLAFSGSFGSFLMSPFTSSMNCVTSLNCR